MSAIVRRSNVRALVLAYQSACERIRANFAEMADIEKSLDEAFITKRAFRIDPTWHSNGVDWDERGMARAIDRIRRRVWWNIVKRLELRRILSAERWKELERALDHDEVPEITEESVVGFAQNYMASIEGMWREAVEEVFRFLRPGSGEYKTNDRYEIGKRVVLSSPVEAWFTGGFKVRYYWRQDIASLERVFKGLDGKGQTLKAYESDLECAIESSADGKGETDYFEFRCFKNGNLHITFKRPDLVQRLNALAGGKVLRPGKVS